MESISSITWTSIFVIIIISISERTAIEQVRKAGTTDYTWKTEWYHQQVDHFSFGNSSKFLQRYLVNDTHWEAAKDERDGGPIFFYTGNEGDIEAFAENTGFMWDIAEEFHAMLVFAEHRYYGQSIPFGNDSLKPGNPELSGYLSSEQALADYAELLTHIKATVKGASTSPVIAFGGSYGGMLAAWFRVKYPHICDGAIAASAPIASFTANCDAFGRVVTSDYSNVDKTSGETARDEIGKSWVSIDKLGSTQDGLAWLKDSFKLCQPVFNTTEHVSSLKSYLNDLWINIAMMDYPYPTSFLKPLPGNPVEFVSKRIAVMPNETTFELNDKNETDQEKLNIRRIITGAEVYYNFTGKESCLNLNAEDNIGADMWDFQACTEMVMPICFKGSPTDMFEPQNWNLTVVEKDCQDRWKVTPRPQMADINYGSKNLHASSNIVFSNGLRDPWSSGGIVKTISDSILSVIIPEGAHHLDLRGSNKLDPKSVVDARNVHRDNIQKWINKASIKTASRTSVQVGKESDSAIEHVRIEILP